MGKKMFALIIFLMSISLIGIITVQVFWIGNAIDIREKQFSNDVQFVLNKTNEMIYKRDFVDFTAQFMDFFKTRKFAKQADFTKFVYEQINTSTNESFRFSSSGVYETNYYKGLSDFFKNDSILIATLQSKNEVFKVKKSTNNKELSKIDVAQRFTFFNNLTEIEKLSLENAYHNKSEPIEKRLSNEIVAEVLGRELLNSGIDLHFEFGVFVDQSPTSIQTSDFQDYSGKRYKTSLFAKDTDSKNYELFVTFPQKKYLLADLRPMLLLSVFFTGIIILAFASSLYQLIKQKKIAAIKTDFINNMTHEFKTPIATINLALDAIKNPQIIQDQQKVMKYVGMIKDENKRMNAQVENVLRISKLEKNQFEVEKSTLDLSAILQNAMTHVDLLLKDKHGEMRFHPDEKNCLISGNENHLTNAFVNILENAIKYSIDSPKIDIFIKGATNLISVQIKDCGIGMSKTSQRQVFDKFYREQVGNIHNIKGHGLGLSYVKEIVKLHQGTVFVKSEKGKGSVFTIQFPRIP